MKKLLLAVLLCVAWVLPTACYAGPFGLEPGMSRAEVVQKVGKSAIVEERGDFIAFKTAPMGSIFFDDYMCFFDKNNRLWSISASSKIRTTTDGEDLRTSFDELKTGLEDKYGTALYVTGSKAGKKWADLGGSWAVFTAAYWAEDRKLRLSSHISRIALEVKQGDKDHGLIELTYEFTTLVEDPL